MLTLNFYVQDVQEKKGVFSKNFPNFAISLPRQHFAAIGCTENGHPIAAVTVQFHCVENFKDILERYVDKL